MSAEECVTDMGLQALLLGKYNGATAAAAAIDAVTPSAVEAVSSPLWDLDRQKFLLNTLRFKLKFICNLIKILNHQFPLQALKKVSSGNLSMSALGNVANIPYLDQL